MVERKIYLYETHLSYLWCCCFAVVGLGNIYYRKGESQEVVARFNDDPEYKISMDTLHWGRSLLKEFDVWPTIIANPLQQTETVSNANNLFVAVVISMLFHEVGHLVLHRTFADFLIQIQSSNYRKTQEDYRKLRRMEKEADDYAFDCMLTSSSQLEVRFINQLGTMVVHMISLYHLDTADTRMQSHPDVDDRLRNIVKQLKFGNEAERIQMKSLCCLGVQLFMSLTGVEFIPESEADASFKDFEDLEEHLFGLITKMKDQARNLGI